MADTASERVAEDIARAFHEAYESLAPQFGYETREDSRVPWDEVPERNRALMVKTVEALIELGVLFHRPAPETSAPENASNEGAHVTPDAVCNAERERATDAESRKAGPQPEVGRESSGHCLRPRQGQLNTLREALETICEIGETRDVEIARRALASLDEQEGER